MKGAGILGQIHEIYPQQILISASGYSYQEPTEPEFLQYLDTVGFNYLQNKVPNIRSFLNKFNPLFNIFGAYLSGGYLRRVIKTGDAFDHQNSDIDFFFSNETKFRAAVDYINSGDLNIFNRPIEVPYASSRLSYKWNLTSKDPDFPDVTINLMSTIFDIRYRLAAWDLTNSKIATNNSVVIVDNRIDTFEEEGLINVDIFTTDTQIWLNRLARYLQPIIKAVD